MDIELAYGKTGLKVKLPDGWNVTVIEPGFAPGLLDPQDALRQALETPIKSKPLRDVVKSTDKVGIIFSDITRPTPNRLILPAILNELPHVSRENIVLFAALGTHRPNTDAELYDLLGEESVKTYRIVQNDAFNSASQVRLGTTSRGHEIWLNRELIDCDVKILTGFIEPHFFAGFSGGGKAIMPGMAGQKTVLGNHDATMIRHPKSTWGETWGNPIWEEIREVALQVGPTFLVNVSLNKDREITGIFAGDLDSAYAAGCAAVKAKSMVPVLSPFDIVITTNSGYPLDLNLYQSVKGMSAAAQVVREGGAIIVAADCWDGIPDHGLYGQLLRKAENPQALLDAICTPGFLKQDQWQAQIQAQIQLRADVYVFSENLTIEQIERALLRPCKDIRAIITELLENYGHGARICVLPQGPQTIPYVSHSPMLADSIAN